MSFRLRVKVAPRSGRDEIVGWRDGELQLRVRSAPESGKANVAVSRLLGEALGVPRTSVWVERGHSSRHKTILIEDLDERDALDVLGRPEST